MGTADGAGMGTADGDEMGTLVGTAVGAGMGAAVGLPEGAGAGIFVLPRGFFVLRLQPQHGLSSQFRGECQRPCL